MTPGSTRHLPPPLPPGTRIKKLGERPLPSYEQCTPEQQALIDEITRYFYETTLLNNPKFWEKVNDPKLEKYVKTVWKGRTGA